MQLRLAYVFPGQGAQVVGMGQALAQKYEEANDVFRTMDETLGFSVSSLCFSGPEEELRQTYNTQPALLGTSVAAYRVFQSLVGPEVKPAFMAGHSLGEYSACVAAGALSLTDGLTLVRSRGVWMDQAVPAGEGAMAAVLGMEADALRAVCEESSTESDRVELANVNCPGQIVISGAKLAVERAGVLAKDRGAKRVIPLTVSGPFHSSLMEPAAKKLERALADVHFSSPSAPIVSNVDVTPNQDPDGLRLALHRQLCSPVLWEQDVRFMLAEGVDVFVEFGPGTVLSGLIRKIDKGIPTLHVEDESSLQEAVEYIERRGLD